MSIVVGAHNILNKKEPSQQRFSIKRAIIHDVYLKEKPRFDMAFLQLDGSLTYSDEVRPICVDASRFSDNTPCVVAGWGRTSVEGLHPYYEY